MDVTRWQRLEELFHSLSDLAAGPEREVRVRALCEHDPDLATALGRLLAANDSLRGVGAPVDQHLGVRLGSYEIDTLIARGGMASVYAAHRADEQFNQRVAVKIMDLRLSDPSLVARFKAERQILAGLEHPALTRLLDGGVTGLGEPYLVMDYVEGQPIDLYCDEHRLDIAGRLRLFAQVCAGVAFAHRHLVLHRDLKPANILVTAEGLVKIVDFGTATLLQPERLMTVSPAPLTPAYASPEQLTGQAVDTASDQYSLGLVLYELLTGVAPFATRASLMAAVERALAGVEPTAPHLAVTEGAPGPRRTSLARLRRQLKGDLGTIVRKALVAHTAERYASVQHLADDLDRWTRGEPILGRTPSVAYRASRFVQRHWVAVSVATTLLVSLVAATAVSFQQASIARAESGKARQLNRFLTDMLSSANPSWFNANAGNAGSITVREVLDGASMLIETELSDQPAVEAELRRTLGRTYIGLGVVDQALPHLNRALTLYQGEADAFGIAFTQMLLGEHRIRTGDFKAAEGFLRESIAYVRSRGSLADPELHLIATNDLAVALNYQQPGHAEAVALLRESLEVSDRSGLNRAGASVVVHNLAFLALRNGQIDEAEVLLRDALRRMNALPVDVPERSLVHRTQSDLFFQRGNYAEAERQAAAAVEGAARMLPADHPIQPVYQAAWGRTLVAAGRLEQGRTVLRQAFASISKMRPAGHIDLVASLIGLGSVDRLQGRLNESEQLLRQARAIVVQHPAYTEHTAAAAAELGLTLGALGKTSEAFELLKESHAVLRAAYGDEHPLTQQALARLQGSE